jgi:hypothetical protein
LTSRNSKYRDEPSREGLPSPQVTGLPEELAALGIVSGTRELVHSKFNLGIAIPIKVRCQFSAVKYVTLADSYELGR